MTYVSDSGIKINAGKRKAPPHAFKPGQSGNPDGRPKGDKEFRAKCREHSDEALEALLKEMAYGKNIVAAAQTILAYAWGKPTDKVELTGADGGPLLPLTRDEVLGALDESRRAANTNVPSAALVSGESLE